MFPMTSQEYQEEDPYFVEWALRFEKMDLDVENQLIQQRHGG